MKQMAIGVITGATSAMANRAADDRRAARWWSRAALAVALLAPAMASAQGIGLTQNASGGRPGTSSSGSGSFGGMGMPGQGSSSHGLPGLGSSGLGGGSGMTGSGVMGAGLGNPGGTRPGGMTGSSGAMGSGHTGASGASSGPYGAQSGSQKPKNALSSKQKKKTTTSLPILSKYDYSYGADGTGTDAKSVYGDRWQKPEDDYQWGAVPDK